MWNTLVFDVVLGFLLQEHARGPPSNCSHIAVFSRILSIKPIETHSLLFLDAMCFEYKPTKSSEIYPIHLAGTNLRPNAGFLHMDDRQHSENIVLYGYLRINPLIGSTTIIAAVLDLQAVRGPFPSCLHSRRL